MSTPSALPIMQFLSIGIGAACGAWLRWGLGLYFNQLTPKLPLGTLLANLLGGFLIGVAFAVFQAYPKLDAVWRVLITTGFLGGLTTFSTFSLENFQLLQQGNYVLALLHLLIHCAGSLLATFLGYFLLKYLV